MTAIKTPGLGDRWLVGGYDLSGDTQQIGRVGGGPVALEFTDITQSGHERKGGELTGDMAWVSFFDKQAGYAHKVLSLLPRTSATISYLHQPTAVGSAIASIKAMQIGYDPTRGQDGMLTVAVAAQGSDGYPLEWGQALQVGVRTDTTATNGTALDGGAATSFGLSAYLHVTGITGTSVTVKLQDSADNSAWADITGAAFTAATAVGDQRIATANNATVRRYVRAVTSGTFTSASFVVNFVRREVTVNY